VIELTINEILMVRENPISFEWNNFVQTLLTSADQTLNYWSLSSENRGVYTKRKV
jgi:hypothetical protein